MKPFIQLSKAPVLLFVLFILGFAACDSDDGSGGGSINPPGTDNRPTGWFSTDDPSTIPSDINLGGDNDLPKQYSLLNRFPPVGDQGQYGTCVGWATAYNLKTALNAIDQNWTRTNELVSSDLHGSPKDLFLSIPNSQKGASCNGTNFEPALDRLMQRGVASMTSEPYTGLGDCSQSANTSLDAEAATNKIANYRKINMDVNTIKTYISQNRPVVFGALVGDIFQQLRGDQVLTSDGGNSGGHAMTIVGYDDSRGPNGAFEVLNSWSEVWGDNGVGWVDYNLMTDPNWAMLGFVATNSNTPDFNPSDSTAPTVSDFDLIPWYVGDQFTDGQINTTNRSMSYNVYNIGAQTVPASYDWSMCYLYYNAYDASDYGILIYDYFSDDFGSPGDDGSIPQGGPGIAANWYNYIDLPSYSGVAEELYGNQYFIWDYQMPNITGQYYLVCIADAFDAVKELDEANNYYFLTSRSGGPVTIINGIVDEFNLDEPQDSAQPRMKADRPQPGVALPRPSDEKGYHNAYTPKEISNMITQLKKSGELRSAIAEYRSRRTSAK